MRRLLLLMVCVLMGIYVSAQTEDAQKNNAQTDKQNTKQSNIDDSQTPTEDDPWSLFVKEIKVKGKEKWKKMQMGFDIPGQKWELTGKVVDTLGNPIEGVRVMSYYYNSGDIYDSEYVTEKDGSYIVRCQLLRTNRVFKKKGYRVAGEVRPGTKVFAFHRYTLPNPIVMVPVDFNGNEAKYNEGVERHEAPRIVVPGRGPLPPETWRTYYEFEDLKFFDYIKRYNILTIKGTTLSVTRNLGKVILIDSLDYVLQKRREARREERVIKRSIRVYRKIQEKEAKKRGVPLTSLMTVTDSVTEPAVEPVVASVTESVVDSVAKPNLDNFIMSLNTTPQQTNGLIMAQKNRIIGRVVDENGNPLPGVMVRIVQSRGDSDVTDDNGLFMLSYKENAFDNLSRYNNQLRDGDLVYFQKEGYELKKKYSGNHERKEYAFLEYNIQNPDVVMISKEAKARQIEEKKKSKKKK